MSIFADMKMLKRRWVLICGIFLTAASIFAQDLEELGDEMDRRRFQADFGQFKSGDKNLSRLELYYKIYNSTLQFVKKGGIYTAEYEIAVTIYDDDNKQVDAFVQDKSITLTAYESTISYYDYRISQLNQYLPPGKYKIDITLRDKNSNYLITKTLKPKLTEYGSRHPQLSGIEFAQSVNTIILDTLFRKGDLSVIPLAGREYSGDSSINLIYYYEIYQGSDKSKKCVIESRILDSHKGTTYADTITVNFEDKKDRVELVRQVRRIPLNNIKSGEYTLEIGIIGRRNRMVDRTKSEFSLYWSPEAMVLNDFETAVQQLKYIADPADIKNLEQAETMEDKMARWNEFWKSRDPSPNTPQNEAKSNYYRRIEYANRRFSVLKKAGWRTDRGMVYIQYGNPDQIEDYPFELSTKAYQIWHYYRLKEHRRFVFVDEWGDGDFRLQYPYDGRNW